MCGGCGWCSALTRALATQLRVRRLLITRSPLNAGCRRQSSLAGDHSDSHKIAGSTAFCCPELLAWATEVEAGRGQSGWDVSLKTAVRTKLESPEQVDLWSFGVTLFFMVTGQQLLPNAYDVLTDAARERVLNWSGLTPEEIKELRTAHGADSHFQITAVIDLLQWLLDTEPTQRPLDMSIVLAHAFFDPKHGSLREHFAVTHIRSMLETPGEKPAVKVMISYCWADSTFVLSKLAPQLAPSVDSLWLDRLGGDQGMGEWTRASMEAGVGNADVILAVVSPAYAKSKNCGCVCFPLKLMNLHTHTLCLRLHQTHPAPRSGARAMISLGCSDNCAN